MVGFLEKIWKKNNEKSEEYLKSTINDRSGALGYTSLHNAVSCNKADEVRKLINFGADINCKSDGGYTPLHIAASIDACSCIEVLLEYNATTNLCDENKKTPYGIAVCNNCITSARLLLSHDVLAALKHGKYDDFVRYVKTVRSDNVTSDCFDKCLKLAIEKDYFAVVGLIMLRKPRHAKDCLIDALKNTDGSKSTLVLLLCYAVEKHFNDVIKVICENKEFEFGKNQWSKCDIQISAETLHHLKSFVNSIKSCIAYPVSIGCNRLVKNYKGVEFMLLNIYSDKKNLKADWGGLLLRFFHEDWLKGLEKEKIKDIVLSKNKIKSIPSADILSYLGAVEKLNLSKNKLQEVPVELFRLPKLSILNLSSNQLRHLPNVKEWSPFLTSLYLQKNLLESFPVNVEKLSVKHLHLADNRLASVPESICKLKCLETLDISRNLDIDSLPVNMGKLSKLNQLDLDGLTIRGLPIECKKSKDILNHLIATLRNSKPYYKMKLMIIGSPQQGKTTLLKRLKEDTSYNVDQSTHGIDIEEVTISFPRKKLFTFRAWDFAGQEEYFATHQCFLSTSSLYLLVWNVNEKNKCIQQLKPWFENLIARVKVFYIIVVGTKIDLLKVEDLDNACNQMKAEIEGLIETIPAVKNFKNCDLCFSSRLKFFFLSLDPKFPSYSKDIGRLKDEIYLLAETMTFDGKQSGEKIMGKLFPQSYAKLEEEINEIKKQKEKNCEVPIISREEFISMGKSLKCNDPFQDDDLEPATKFLKNTGTILHFDGANDSLNDIFFINPSWVCKLMAKFITVDAAHTFAKNGILKQDSIPLILKEELENQNADLINKYLSLLSRFQVACKIDDHRFLIPPKLPKYDPKHALTINLSSLLTRYYFFSCIPYGFWARFITRFLSMTKEMLSPIPNIDVKPKVFIPCCDLPKDELDSIIPYGEDEKPLKINHTSSSNCLYIITSPKNNPGISQIHSSQQLSRNLEQSINNPSALDNNSVRCFPIKYLSNKSDTSNESKNSNSHSSNSQSSTVSADCFSDAKSPYKHTSSYNNINEEPNSDCSTKVSNNIQIECLNGISTKDFVIEENQFPLNDEKYEINNNLLNNDRGKGRIFADRTPDGKIDLEQSCTEDCSLFNNDVDNDVDNDVANDVVNDADTGVDTGVDNNVDISVDNDINTSVDKDIDMGVDNNVDTGVDNNVDTGVDTCVYNDDVDNGVDNDVDNDTGVKNDVDISVKTDVDTGVSNDVNNDDCRYFDTGVNNMIDTGLPIVENYFTHVSKNKLKINTNKGISSNLDFSDSNCCDVNCNDDEVLKQVIYNIDSEMVSAKGDIEITETDDYMPMVTEMDNIGYFDASMQIISKQDYESHSYTNEEDNEIQSQLINGLLNMCESYEEHFNDYGELAYLLDNGYLSCWNQGIIFNHSQLNFSVQQLPITIKEDRETIEIRVTNSPLGYRVLSYVVDHIRTLLNEWYEGLLMSGKEPQVISSLACPVCTRLGINPPHLFNISTAFQKMYQSSEDNTCNVFCERKHKPRTVNIAEFCPDLTFHDLPKTMKLNCNDILCEQNEKCKLGEGQFGNVYSGLCKQIRAAIKFYKFKMNNSDEISSSLDKFYEIRQEIVMLSKLRHHPYIIQFLGFSLKPELCAVMERAIHGALSSVIHKKSETGSEFIPRIVKFRICQQIASAVAFMHKKYIIHRDIKSDNILLFSLNHGAKINIKLTDFGTANFMSPSGMKNIFGTKGYTAPEMILHKSFLDEYSSSVDIYSFAMVLYELIAYQKPFYQVSKLLIDSHVINGLRPKYNDIPCAFYGLFYLTKLMITMWNQDPSKRPSANDVLNILSPTLQLVYGLKILHSLENPREMCYITSCNELWILCDDKKEQSIVVINMKSFEVVHKIQIDAEHFGLENFNMASITPIGDMHICVVLRSLIDVVLVYKAKNYSVFKSYKIEDGFICSISANKDWVCLGFDDGHCFKVNINAFLNGKMFRKLIPFGSTSEKYPVTTSVILSETFIWSVGTSVALCNLKKDEEEKKPCHMERKVQEIVHSFDKKTFFISFQNSPEIYLHSGETKETLHKFNCTDDVLSCSPEALNVDLRVTCMCSVENMLWVGTGGGHILIYEVHEVFGIYKDKLLLSLHPYANEMRKLELVVLSPEQVKEGQDGVKYLIVSIGKELNKTAFGVGSFFDLNCFIPKDQTVIDLCKQLDIDGKVIIVWHVLPSDQYKNLVLS